MSTFTVSNTADSGPGSLRYEIELANSNAGDSTIDFDSTVFSTALTITLTSGQLELSNTRYTETIVGPAAGVTVNGGGQSRVFQVDANVTASISGLTITRGSASGPGGGLANYGGTVALSDCTVSGNTAQGNGGGLYQSQGTTALYACTVSGNTAQGNGGGLYDFVGTTALSNVLVSGNAASNGGGLSTFFGTTTLTNCNFSGDLARRSGGGLYNNGGTTTLTGCTFSGESAAVNGGGLYTSGYGTTALSDCTLGGNSASSSGGGLANAGGSTTTLTNCTVCGDSAGSGGGLANFKGTTKLDDVLITGDTASDGGGLYNDGGTTKLGTYGTNQNAYAQAFACAVSIYADTTSFGGDTTAQGCGFSVNWPGGSGATYNVASNGSAFGVPSYSNQQVCSLLQNINNNFYPSNGNFYGGNQTKTGAACNVLNGINTAGHISNGLTLTAPSGSVAYTPAQIRDAYGINGLSLDGTGQTIAIVDAYNDPDIFQALDLFDSQFSLTDSGPTLYSQYGPASSFLTVLSEAGQTTPLSSTDPNGPGTANWELEAALDVEWAHAIAPGAQIVLVEANSQSLSDLMAAVSTADSQPGVSVVSMSWGFGEGQSVLAADEPNYDSVFNVPGVTFLASTGDYGAADPEYPAFSPNVVAVGGTTLNLNTDNSYNSETGWGYYSDSAGVSIGSGGGISLYEPEPAYQQGVQSTGYRTTPDVSMVADPATGGWIADPYNLDPSDPFEVAGGTSLAARAWAGLIALVNQGRVAAGESTLNSSSPTEAQQALYSLPQADYNVISSGDNGYDANPRYNLVIGLGTPVAGALVPDLVAYSGPGTTYSGPTVGPLQDATLDTSWTDAGGSFDILSVFDAPTVPGGSGIATNRSPTADVADRTVTAQDVKLSDGPDGAAAREMPVVSPVVPAVAIPTAPGSDIGPVEIMPLADALAAHDAVLARWSSSAPSSPTRVAMRTTVKTVPAVSNRPGPARGWAWTAVLQGRPVAATIGGLGALPSLPVSDGETASSYGSKPLRPIA